MQGEFSLIHDCQWCIDCLCVRLSGMECCYRSLYSTLTVCVLKVLCVCVCFWYIHCLFVVEWHGVFLL